MDKSAKVISDAILGDDFKTVVVGGKAYTIEAPTIKVIAGVAGCLSEIDLSDKAESFRDLLLSNKDADQYAKALSWMVNGDDKLSEEFEKAPYKDVISALCEGFDLLSPQVFCKAASLTRTACRLTATPRQR